MVAIAQIIAGEESPYGLFHATRTPVEKLRAKGLRANALGTYSVHRLIERLQRHLAPVLEAARNRYDRTQESYFPLELSLWEQLAVAPSHFSAVLLTLTQEDACLGAEAGSEPNRKAQALVDFARQFAPLVFETVMQMYDRDTVHALNTLNELSDSPSYLLRIRTKPPIEDGFFSLLAAPYLEVNGVMRSYARGPNLRPEARAIWFNGVIHFDCVEVLPVPPGLFTQ